MPKGVYDRTAAVKRGAWKKAAKTRAKTMAAEKSKPAKRTAKPKAAKKSRRRA